MCTVIPADITYTQNTRVHLLLPSSFLECLKLYFMPDCNLRITMLPIYIFILNVVSLCGFRHYFPLKLVNPVKTMKLSPYSLFNTKKNWDLPNEINNNKEGGGLVYGVEMSRSAGISWGSDISFRWIYVLDLDPNGEASSTGLIKKGDYIIGAGNVSLIAQDFDYVLTVHI